MRCPACPKTDMFALEFEQIELDYCPTCRGVWLDSGELELIGEKAGALQGEFLAALEAPESAEKAVLSDRRCPTCRTKLAELAVPGEPPITLDRCRSAHGLWFDPGELRHVIAHAETKEDNMLVRFFADLEADTPQGDTL